MTHIAHVRQPSTMRHDMNLDTTILYESKPSNNIKWLRTGTSMAKDRFTGVLEF